MDTQARIAGISLALAFFLGFIQLAWPGMPHYLSFPGVALSLLAAAWFGAPWLRNLRDHLSPAAIGSLIDASMLRIKSWSVPEWQIAYGARTDWGDSYSVNSLKEAKAELEKLVKEYDGLRQELADALKNHGRRGPSSPVTELEAPEILAARDAVRTKQDEITQAQIRVNLREDSLQRELVSNLSSGELIAKGIDQAQRECIIPAYQWRILKLDILNDSASGHGLSYVGVVIGKPRRK